MQHKTTYLKRLMAIYVAFFVVLLAGLTLHVAPGFQQGLEEGMRMGNELNASLEENIPQTRYLFWNIPVQATQPTAIQTADSTRCVVGHPATMTLDIKEPAGDRSAWWLAFATICGSPWIYVLTLLSILTYVVIIVLMWLIIRSVRRSIREEQPMATCNVWRLRTIALLTIATDLITRTANWMAATNAARLLEGSDYIVNTRFALDADPFIFGLLILFAAELTAIGRDLGEEQKLTI